jgi:hypothetical protein
MGAVHHQRSAQRATLEYGLHGPVAGVEAAHEAYLHQPSTGGDLCIDYAHTRIRRRRQGLLTKDWLAVLQRRQDELFVRRTPRGDDNGSHVWRSDQILARFEDLRASGMRDGRGTLPVDVRNTDHTGVGQTARQAPNVILTNVAGADDTNAHRHPSKPHARK